MTEKNYFGFQFAKIGIAALSDNKTDFTYQGKVIQGWDVVISFLHSGCESVGQSTYLIFVNDQLKYAGEYSGTFQERWLLPRNGLWYLQHSENDNRIQDVAVHFLNTTDGARRFHRRYPNQPIFIRETLFHRWQRPFCFFPKLP